MNGKKDIEVMEVPVRQTSQIQGIIAQAEIDSQIATAKRFPRNIEQFKSDLMDEAVSLEQAAIRDEHAACYYVLPRADKIIEGPNIRLAEIAFRRFTNLLAQAEVSHADNKRVYAVGMARDLENNIAVRVVVWRKITDKHGRRFSDDMIFVTGNAAASIAFREAIIKIIGRSHLNPVWEKCKQIRAEGTKVKDVGTVAKKAIDYLVKQGAKKEDVLASLGRKSISEIDRADIATLRGYATAIKDGEASVSDFFGPIEPAPDKPPADRDIEPKEMQEPKAEKKTKKKTRKKKGKTNLF